MESASLKRRLYLFRDVNEPYVLNGLDLSQCRKMYSQSHVGAVFLGETLDEKFHERLRREIVDTKDSLFECSSGQENGFKMNMLTRTIGSPNSGIDMTLNDLPACSELVNAYKRDVYDAVARMARFDANKGFISLTINMYPAIGGGMDYHQDARTSMNLVGVLAVEGHALFTLARDRDGKEKQSYITRPGDLVLMRAYRRGCEEKHDPRPFHKVEALGQDRYSIILRNYS